MQTSFQVSPKSLPGSSRKVLALLCLRRALMDERYEECRTFLEEAQKRGADTREIARILRSPELHLEEMEN